MLICLNRHRLKLDALHDFWPEVVLLPFTELFLFFIPMPVKAKYVIPVYVLIDLSGAFNRSAGDNVGHFAHLGGAAVGLLIVLFMNRNNRRDFY